MRSEIDSVLRNELDNKGYMCPRCRKSFSTLDVGALLDPITMMTFICDTPGCHGELVDNEDAEDVKRSKDRLKRFNEQCGAILDKLRKIDTVILPNFDVLRELERNGNSDSWRLRARQRIDPNATMKDIQESQGEARRAASVEIDMLSNDPIAEAARRQQREREAERQKQENALPSWWETTQDPNAPKIVKSSINNSQENGKGIVTENGNINSVQDDYYAKYASMAQNGDEIDEDDEEVDLDDVGVGYDTTTTPSGPSAAQTPLPNHVTTNKHSREESDSNDNFSKKIKRDTNDDEDEDDEDEMQFEDVA